MVVRGRPKERGQVQRDFSRSKLKGKKRKLKCWNCSKSGHLKKESWKRQQASKEDSSKETKKENTTETGSGMANEVLTISIVSCHDQHWLLDSGASNHMCLHKHWFITYQSINDGIVYMGNDISCKVVGISSI
jgi:hypothetical protein